MAEHFTWGSALPTLRAGNVVLRPLTLPDYEDLFQVFSDQEVMRYRDGVLMTSLSDASAYIAGVQRGFDGRQLFEWGVATTTDDRVVGTCTLFRLDDRHRRAEIGFALGRAFWGQGLGSSAVTRLVTFAFEDVDLLRLEADADPRNVRSLRLLRFQARRAVAGAVSRGRRTARCRCSRAAPPRMARALNASKSRTPIRLPHSAYGQLLKGCL